MTCSAEQHLHQLCFVYLIFALGGHAILVSVLNRHPHVTHAFAPARSHSPFTNGLSHLPSASYMDMTLRESAWEGERLEALGNQIPHDLCNVFLTPPSAANHAHACQFVQREGEAAL